MPQIIPVDFSLFKLTEFHSQWVGTDENGVNGETMPNNTIPVMPTALTSPARDALFADEHRGIATAERVHVPGPGAGNDVEVVFHLLNLGGLGGRRGRVRVPRVVVGPGRQLPAPPRDRVASTTRRAVALSSSGSKGLVI